MNTRPLSLCACWASHSKFSPHFADMTSPTRLGRLPVRFWSMVVGQSQVHRWGEEIWGSDPVHPKCAHWGWGRGSVNLAFFHHEPGKPSSLYEQQYCFVHGGLVILDQVWALLLEWREIVMQLQCSVIQYYTIHTYTCERIGSNQVHLKHMHDLKEVIDSVWVIICPYLFS